MSTLHTWPRYTTLSACLWTATALAGPVYFEQERAEDFGDLTQPEVTACPDQGCGPAAAVNSFVFLQRQSGLYGSRLVPAVDPGNPTHAEMAAVANDLARNYMGSCCAGGTHITSFINGKLRYLDAVAPQSTDVHAQVHEWDVSKGGAKPDFVDEHNPTPQFMLSELRHNEDIELLFAFEDGGGHYVTLTSLFWSDDNDNGSIDSGEAAHITFIDPFDGKPASATIGQENGGMTLRYLNPRTGNFDVGKIFAAVAESPSGKGLAEPTTGLVVLAGLALMALSRVMARRSPELDARGAASDHAASPSSGGLSAAGRHIVSAKSSRPISMRRISLVPAPIS